MSAVADKLREARALIERGWCRRYSERNGHVCSLGAINTVFNGDPNIYIPSSPPRNTAIRYLEAAMDDWPQKFNDRQTSKRPVLRAFDKAIQLAEAGQ